MTNTEIIQAIKAEIERLKSLSNQLDYKNAVGFNWALDDVLSFLDTLESEKPMQEGLEEELDKWRHIHFNGKRDGHFSGEYLERTSQLELARHFYDLGCRRTAEKYDEIEYNRQRFVVETPNNPGDKVRIIILPKEAEQ